MRRRHALVALLSLALALLACALPGAGPTPTATGAAPAGWPTYTNTAHGFALRHPPEFSVPPAEHADAFGWLGDQIIFNIGPANPADCQGGCPVIEATSTAIVAGLTATKLTGYIGSLGGNVPQQYQTYVFTREALYYAFTLYAVPSRVTNTPLLPTNTPAPPTTTDTSLQPLQPADIATFEQMLATLQLTN